MSLRKTLILGVLLLAALAYILKVELPKDEAKKSEGMVLSGLQKESIESIEIKTPKESFVLKNTEPKPAQTAGTEATSIETDALKKWELGDIPGATLDRSAVNALITAALGLKLEDPLPASDVDADLTVYGLKEPELSLSINSLSKDITLEFGKENEYVSKRYLKVAGQPEIYLVGTGLYSAAAKGKENYRNRTPVAFVDGDLKSIAIQNAQSILTKFEMGESYQWRIVEPASYDASNTAVSSLTRDLRALRAAKFIDGKTPADFGLDKPAASISIEFKNAQIAPLELKLATKKDSGKENAFLAVSGEPTIYQLETNPLSAILKPVDAFRETELFRFATDQVVQLDFNLYQEPPVSIVKTGQTWTVNSKPADDAFVRTLIDSLANLKAEGFPKDNRDYGFGNPRLKAVVRLASPGAEKSITERTLVVGDSAAKSGNEDTRYYAATDDFKEPFLIGKESLKAIRPREEVLVKAVASANETPAAEPSPAASKN